MSVYDLYQSYLNQLQQPVAPVAQENILDPSYLLYLQQQQGGGAGDDRFTNVVDPSQQHAGIYSIKDVFEKFKNIPTPFNLARMAIQGIGTLASNIRDPYKTFTGALKPDVQAAITREEVRDLQGRIDRGDFGGKVGGGGFSGHGGYGSSAERGGALHG